MKLLTKFLKDTASALKIPAVIIIWLAAFYFSLYMVESYESNLLMLLVLIVFIGTPFLAIWGVVWWEGENFHSEKLPRSGHSFTCPLCGAERKFNLNGYEMQKHTGVRPVTMCCGYHIQKGFQDESSALLYCKANGIKTTKTA